jgi:predicted AAA+ superfamily ATPase
MIATRDLEKTLKRFSKFPVVVLLGPRQSGKTTLVKKTFPQHMYLTLEDPEILAFVTEDPKRFLRTYTNEHGLILDEFQHAPQFLSYLQIESDERQRPGYFVLTGSQNFLMNQAITQSLAGRAGILHLLPLSIHELIENKLLPPSIDTLLIEGGYPRIHAQNFSPQELFPSYIQTYLERDVRQLINVENIRTFQMFMKLCAGRVGQLLNVADIATNCGISQRTAHQWLAVLEASYIIFLLKPHFNNFNKRIIKTPKLYFYDTGLVSSLLGIRSAQELASSHFRGPLFESLIVSDFYKQYYNLGLTPPLYFWRDHNGRIEVDLLVDRGTSLIPIEIKSGETIVRDFFEPIQKWSAMADHNPEDAYIIYGGESTQKRSTGTVIHWQAAGSLVSDIEQ